MIRLGALIIILMAGFADADGHIDKQKDHPNKIMNNEQCMETKAGVIFFLSAADNVFDEIEEHGDKKDKTWNEEKWTEAIALADLAANYSTVYDVWCKDMIERRIKMQMKKRHQDHNKKKEAKKD